MRVQCVIVLALIFMHSVVYAQNLSRRKRSDYGFFQTGFPFNLHGHAYGYNAYPYHYLYSGYPRYGHSFFNQHAGFPYHSNHHSRKKYSDIEPPPIIIPAGAAAALSVASLLHALISKKFDPPYIPIPITQTLPVPVPLKVPVPLPVNKYIPIGVTTPQRYHHDNKYDVQIHEVHPSIHAQHEHEGADFWNVAEKPYNVDHNNLVTTSAPSIYDHNNRIEKDSLEQNNWKRKIHLRPKRKYGFSAERIEKNN